VRATFRRSVSLLALALLLAACTRERPTPESTPITDQAAAAVSTSTPSAPLEPEVSTTTPEAADAAASLTPEPTTTSVPEEQDVFQYTVQPGDTLFSIAARFGATVDDLVALNSLSTDALIVGQPLYVPYIEGMTAEGLPTPTPGPYRYTIQEGDTLSAIAARFGVDQAAIVEANTLPAPDALTVGAVILIPGYQPPVADTVITTDQGESAEETDASAPSTDAPVIHIVQPDQGLIEIAEIYGVSAADIASANNITNRNVLRVGQELIIPGITNEQATAARSTVHVVESGESLLGIALRYGVTVEEILAVNNIDNPDAIFPGQELLIPLE
jgi:LysM repeat protein